MERGFVQGKQGSQEQEEQGTISGKLFGNGSQEEEQGCQEISVEQEENPPVDGNGEAVVENGQRSERKDKVPSENQVILKRKVGGDNIGGIEACPWLKIIGRRDEKEKDKGNKAKAKIRMGGMSVNHGLVDSNKERPPFGGRCFNRRATDRSDGCRYELGVIPIQPSGRTKGKCQTPDGEPE